MSSDILLADLQKAFLQIAIKEEDRDAFRFLFNINGKEEHLRFTRVPFGAEASPFMLEATLQHHFNEQPPELEDTVQALKENTYVDNLMKTGSGVEELKEFKQEATEILKGARFPVHKRESNIPVLDSEDNPSKLLGLAWNKREDALEIQAQIQGERTPMKRSILSQLSSICDPLGIISPTMVEGKQIYREVCDEKIGWNTEVSSVNMRDWLKWSSQLRNIKVPRSVARDISKIKAVHLHVFADASNIACSAVTVAVVEHSTGFEKGLLTSKSRILNTSISKVRTGERLDGRKHGEKFADSAGAVAYYFGERVDGQYSCAILDLQPRKSMENIRIQLSKENCWITQETRIEWRYCPTDKNLVDLGSRGASLDKMQRGQWFEGSEWLLHEEWPEQPELEKTKSVSEEHRPAKEGTLYSAKKEPDEWDTLLARNKLWRTFRVTAWALRFKHNSLTKKYKAKKRTGPLTIEELSYARDRWIRKEQADVEPDLESPSWKLVTEENTGIFNCKGRVPGYQPTYTEGGVFADKLIRHIHEDIKHLGVASTMAAVNEKWWITQLRSKVKKIINSCYLCKVFSTQPYRPTETAALPPFGTECGRPFETTGIDISQDPSVTIFPRKNRASVTS